MGTLEAANEERRNQSAHKFSVKQSHSLNVSVSTCEGEGERWQQVAQVALYFQHTNSFSFVEPAIHTHTYTHTHTHTHTYTHTHIQRDTHTHTHSWKLFYISHISQVWAVPYWTLATVADTAAYVYVYVCMCMCMSTLPMTSPVSGIYLRS